MKRKEKAQKEEKKNQKREKSNKNKEKKKRKKRRTKVGRLLHQPKQPYFIRMVEDGHCIRVEGSEDLCVIWHICNLRNGSQNGEKFTHTALSASAVVSTPRTVCT